jgi:hypothetical protein
MRFQVLLLIIITAVAACKEPVKGKDGKVYKNAVEYNDYIINRQSVIMQDVIDFLKVSETNLDSARKMLNDYTVKIEKMAEEIKGMPPYKGDSVLRDAAVGSFEFYKKMFQNEYKQIIDIRLSGNDQTEDAEAEMNRIVDKITVEEEKFDKAFHNAQSDFARKNNIRLSENDMQKKFDKATE